jgi:Kef-type K+ transport system membrane component KefB
MGENEDPAGRNYEFSMGSLINPFPALALGLPIVAVLVLLVVGKFAGGYVVGSLIRRRREGSSTPPASYGAWLIPRGEFSLVIGQFAQSVRLIGANLFSLIGLSVLVTAIVGPFIRRFTGPRLASVDHALRPQSD